MEQSHSRFIELVDQARSGVIQLPAFQRDWKWERGKVLALYDSLRKQFPIGNFLFLKISDSYDLSPRPFEGADEATHPTTLTLDGQQRITAGIALSYGLGGTLRYFVDIDAVYQLALEKKIDLDDDEAVREFAQEIDDGDNYAHATTKQTGEDDLLLHEHWISTTRLLNQVKARRKLEDYIEKFPERKKFIDYVLLPHFVIDNNFQCPVITLTEKESLGAVTRIFTTLNTTGKRLTPIEIVTAVLYANRIDLRENVRTMKNSSEYLNNMDSNGEVLLQTIALLDGKTPKKSLLPKNINHINFHDHHEKALSLLDKVGEFLSKKLGVGFEGSDGTSSLIPYDSILAPMAVVFDSIADLDGRERAEAEQKVEEWFVASAIGQRYQEGVHNKQENDAESITEWIFEGNARKPAWIENTVITFGNLIEASKGGARGRLIRCLMNRQTPRDPIEPIKVGFYVDALERSQDHHIWPKKFCEEHIPDWNGDSVNLNSVMNLIPISARTNKRWDKSSPTQQLEDIDNTVENETIKKEIFDSYFLDNSCREIMRKGEKKLEDYLAFLDARSRVFAQMLQRWDIRVVDQAEE